jgi:hypothetical protein
MMQIAKPMVKITNPIMSVSMPKLAYNGIVSRKTTIPIAITKNEAVVSLPNLSTNLFITAYLLNHVSANVTLPR